MVWVILTQRRRKRNATRRNDRHTASTDEEQPLLSRPSTAHTSGSSSQVDTAHKLDESHAVPGSPSDDAGQGQSAVNDASANAAEPPLPTVHAELRRSLTGRRCFRVSMFIGFIAWSIASIFATDVETFGTGLALSEYCGAWTLSLNASLDEEFRDNQYQEQREARASRYARDCYQSSHLSTPDRCQLFYNQSIGYSIERGRFCPFSSPEVCVQPYMTIFFTTGLKDTSILGINADHAPKFRRNTTCAPLSIRERFVETIPSSTSNGTIFKYKYGTTDDSQYTLVTAGDAFESQIPAYVVE